MQTPKARNCCSSEASQKVSPRRISSGVPPKNSPRSASSDVSNKLSPRVVRQLKITSQDSDSSSSRTSRTPNDRSSKLVERKLPRSPVTEKKGPNRVSDLESQVSELQNDLKKVKEQLDYSEEQRNKAQQDADESNRQLLAMSCKLEETQKQALKLSNSEEGIDSKEQLDYSEEQRNKAQQDADETNRQLLAMSCKLEETQKQALKLSNSEECIDSKDHEQQALKQSDSEGTVILEDHVSLFELELEGAKKQNSVDSALLDAVNEIKELKLQLEVVAESEAAQTKQAEVAKGELNTLKASLTDTLTVVEDMKNQLGDSMESEAQAKELVGETLFQLQTAKRTVDELRSDGIKTVEAYDGIASELEQSRARVNLLDALVSKLKSQTDNAAGNESQPVGDPSEPKSSKYEELDLIETEVMSLKSEVDLLRSALEASEITCHERKTQSDIQLKSTYDMVEQMRSSSRAREAELESEIQQARVQIEELKANLMDKETELQGIWEENEGLNMRLSSMDPGKEEFEHGKEIQKAKVDVDILKAKLLDKETELQTTLEENETLKLAIKKKESNNGEVGTEIVHELEAAKTGEREALMQLGYVSEEVDKNNRKIARVSEQIEAAQAANLEMEAELRRLKVQSDQWRKAAEAAATMLSTGNNGKLMDRAVSMDSKYSPRSRANASPYSEEGDDDLIKKKNPNVLKRLGVLWKKPQK